MNPLIKADIIGKLNTIDNMLRGHSATEDQMFELREALENITYTLNACEKPLGRRNPSPTFKKPPASPSPPPMRRQCGACCKDLNKYDWCWFCKLLHGHIKL